MRRLDTLFARLFCILLPIGLVESLGWATPIGSSLAGLMFLTVLHIGDDLVDPFADTIHDVPMTAICRSIGSASRTSSSSAMSRIACQVSFASSSCGLRLPRCW